MHKRWMRGLAISVVLIAVASLLAGCGGVPSAGSGVSLEIRALEVTTYTARIQMTFANRSSFTFYPESATVRGEECSLWSAACVTVEFSMSLSGGGTPLLPGETRSVTEVVPISNGYTRVRWVEFVVRGRLGGSWLEVASNRVYF
uniref:Late embryogenesis abundant protein LEA-2 subgroup domain-containing protein n=1 Tax=Candidatus Caldatribacterium saccharofermentans TaxID=1454753 RepID=A0A7V4TIJ4_9BACT